MRGVFLIFYLSVYLVPTEYYVQLARGLCIGDVWDRLLVGWLAGWLAGGIWAITTFTKALC